MRIMADSHGNNTLPVTGDSFNEGASIRVEHANRRQKNNLGVHRNPRLTLFNPNPVTSGISNLFYKSFWHVEGTLFTGLVTKVYFQRSQVLSWNQEYIIIICLMCIYTYIYTVFRNGNQPVTGVMSRLLYWSSTRPTIVLGFAPGAS